MVARAPGPESDSQQQPSKEHERVAKYEQAVGDEVMTQISKPETENHTEQITEGHHRVDRTLLALLHPNHIGDEVHLDRYNGHGDRMVEHDDPPFALGLHDAHSSGPEDSVLDSKLNHRP